MPESDVSKHDSSKNDNEAPATTGASVLFVCLGNICRSPTAEAVMRRLLDLRGLTEEITVDSAGTSAYHEGEPADPRMRQAASRRGYDLTSRSRQMVGADFERFTLIVAMDRENLRDLRDLIGGEPAHLRLLSNFLPAGGPVDVPDPYWGGGEFEQVMDLLEEACPAILEHLLER